MQPVAPSIGHIMCMRNNFGDKLFGRERLCVLRYHSPGYREDRSEKTQVKEYGPVLCNFEMEEIRIDHRKQQKDRCESASYKGNKAIDAVLE